MSIYKGKRSEQSPFAVNRQLQKDSHLVFDFTPKKLESLECFFGRKRFIKPEAKRQGRIKSVSNIQPRAEMKQ